MLHELSQKLDAHAQLANQRMETSLRDYFHPDSGQFCQRVKGLVDQDGQLAQLIRGLVDGEQSRLAQTLVGHVGKDSPLFKWLNSDESQGFLAAMRTSVEARLLEQRTHLLAQFSLDTQDGALSRLVKELKATHGDLETALQKKIDCVVKEFSLDEENSALRRLVKSVEGAQRTITSEFSLDNEQSALLRLKKELTTILEAHVQASGDFQRRVELSLEKLATRREQELRSTLHGATFQNAVYAFLDQQAQRRGDIAEDTSGTTGLIKNCKIGDAVIQLGQDCAAAGARIVFESKEEIGYTLRAAKEEIAKARKNRDAQQGVFIFSQRTAPVTESLARHGDDVFVVWNAEDPGTDAYLNAALEISRALCLRSHKAAAQQIDFEPIDRALRAVEKCAANLDEVGKSAESIKKSADKILDRARIDRVDLVKQVTLLQDAVNHVKHTLGGDSSAADVPAV
jgi:hypothetical protein